MANTGEGMYDMLSKWNGNGEDESAGNRKETKGATDDDGFNTRDINIATATGKIVSLKAEGSDTIGCMKLKIQDVERIPFDQQELIFDGMVLDNINALANLSITKESILTLVRKPRGLMNIFVVVPEERTYSLEVNPSDAIYKVKGKLFAMRTKMSPIGYYRDMLVFNGIVLEDGATLNDFNVINGSTLTYFVNSGGLMEIFVNTFSGKTITLSVNPTYTICQVKSKIESQEDIPCDEQALIFNKTVLGDSGTLFDFQIYNKSTLTLMRKSKGFMQISIETFTGETITLQVKPSDTIADVKEEIEDETNIPFLEMEVIYKDMVLDNNAALADFHINNKSTLTLMRVSTGFMPIYIKTLAGKNISLKVKPSQPIQFVKSKIRDKEGIPQSEQTLIFNGKRLQDGATIADYHIHQESTIHLFTTRGGMMKV